MSTKAPVAERDRPPLPAEPTVWQRYSPHHEFPISTLATVAIYGLATLLIVALGALAFRWSSSPLPIVDDALLTFEPVEDGGGSGLGNGTADKNIRLEENALPFVPSITAINGPPELHDEGTRPLLAKDADAVRFQVGPKRQDSKGSREEGGSGGGEGAFVGDGKGPGKPRKDPRLLRMDRWIITFNYNSSSQYLERLANLKAFLVFPRDKDAFLLFDDLEKRTPTGKTVSQAEIGKLNRVYWRDSNADVVHDLASNLGVSPPPPSFWIFLPNDLEKALLDKELAYRGLTEAQINERRLETTFDIQRNGDQWQIRVIKQDVKARR